MARGELQEVVIAGHSTEPALGIDLVSGLQMIRAAARAGIRVLRVPKYSPNAVAEHAVSLTCTLNRRLHLYHNHVRDCSQMAHQPLLPPGVELCEKTCGIIGTGKIGQIAAKIFRQGFGMRVLCYDVYPNKAVMEEELGCQYVDTLDELYAAADVISLHVPLLDTTRHMINAASLAKMRPGVMLINCSRGGLIDSRDLITALKTGKVAGAGLDVYESEDDFFFRDFTTLADREAVPAFTYEFTLLRSFPELILTPHSAFLTKEALRAICDTTLLNASAFFSGQHPLPNEVQPAP